MPKKLVACPQPDEAPTINQTRIELLLDPKHELAGSPPSHLLEGGQGRKTGSEVALGTQAGKFSWEDKLENHRVSRAGKRKEAK